MLSKWQPSVGFIWKGRNEFGFNGSPVNPMIVVKKYEGPWADYSRANSLEERGVDDQVTATSQAKGAPPPVGFILVNCEAAVHASKSIATLAAIICDTNGKVIDEN
ncbi:hypothetical protein RHMOL_Rhmol02G0087200 [Rhododendron molle]|uniref:Uncharacterized protein n=1 Tax=Rhododendron molle TaxID=49168 RepID=A0ACC0PPB1_RHOML|nr:hypothetical protein RHMOL_Rhmol02G0087200 [Rhododendron molle]